MRKLLIGIIPLLCFSCSPQLKVTLKKHYPPNNSDSLIEIYQKPQEIPLESELVGTIKIHCVEGVKNCDSSFVSLLAQSEAKKVGGNALLITKFQKPSTWNSNLQMNAEIMRVSDFSSPRDSLYSKRIPKSTEFYGKGTWDLRLSLPYINQFILQPEGESLVSTV